MPPLKVLGIGISLAVALPALAGSLAAPSATVHRPQRIVSLNLCSDQYLVELADPGQIAGLTANAADREMSAVAGRVGKVHLLSDSAEEILAIQPDLVVGMPARRSGMMAVLSNQNYRSVELRNTANYADIVAQIREIALAVGHPARGEALIARMNRDLSAVRRPARGGVAAYYQRRGFLTGTGTLIDDIMKRAGLSNLATKLGKPALSQVSLEELMVAQPDYMIVETETDRITDQGTEMLHHPLLRDIPRLRVPQAWTVCGGPAYVDAVRSLAAQIARSNGSKAH
jgi:iron complex transport system substrate-binding protein